MVQEAVIALGDLIRSRRPGHGLSAGFYGRADLFDAEMAVFFRRHWIYVGLDLDVPAPGSVSTLDIGGASILIVRGDDGVVRGFHNVCRHRGARLMECGTASVRRLVCPYHRWTYDLAGDLAVARHMGKDFDRAGHGLSPIALRSVGGLLFACLEDDPPADFEALAAVMAPRLAPFDLTQARIAATTDLIEEGNWKIVIDNNRECYHCAGSHPELNRSFVAEDFGFDPDELSEAKAAEARAHQAACARQTAAWEAEGYPSQAVERLTGCASAFRTQRLVIRGAGESQTLDTGVACRKPLGDIGTRALGDLHFWTHNSWHHFMSDHVVTICLMPLAPGRSLIRTKWLVHRDAVEGVDYDPETLIRVWTATNRQDKALVERTQRGVLDPAYRPGPYSVHTETYLEQFAVWYLERMSAHGF